MLNAKMAALTSGTRANLTPQGWHRTRWSLASIAVAQLGGLPPGV